MFYSISCPVSCLWWLILSLYFLEQILLMLEEVKRVGGKSSPAFSASKKQAEFRHRLHIQDQGGGCLGKGNESGSCHVCIWRRMFVCVGGFRCAGCGFKKVYWVVLQLLLFPPTSHFSLNPSHIFTDHLYGSPSLPPHPSDQR